VNSRFGPLRKSRRSAEIAALLSLKLLALTVLYFLFFSTDHQIRVDPSTTRSHLLDFHR
jgi:hypothetical protein